MTVPAVPQNLDAEQSVIGCVLRDPGCLDELDLIPEEFYHAKFEKIYRTLRGMHLECQQIDLITVTDRLPDLAMDVARSLNTIATTANVKEYAGIVKSKAKLRQIIRAGEQIQKLPGTEYENVDELISQAEKTVYDLSASRTGRDIATAGQALNEYSELANEAARHPGGMTGLNALFGRLNHLTSGLQKQDLIVLGARPSMGKTALALNLAAHAVRYGHPTVIFSLEMSRRKLVMRMIAAEALVNTRKLKALNLTHEESRRYTAAYEQLEKSLLFIDDTPAISAMEIFSKCRRLKKQHGLELIIVDYLGLMAGVKGLKRYEAVSENVRVLKNVAREIDCPLLCLSQLSREVERRDTKNKRPQMSDLRETGEIEQTADMIWFLYRDEYYHPETEKKGAAELIIAKQRDGPTGVVDLAWTEEYTKFTDPDKKPETENVQTELPREWAK